MSKRRKPPPHRFGWFKVKRVRIRNWDIPRNSDDDVIWLGKSDWPDIEPRREGRRRK